jgi:hypothetical protein
MHYLLLPVQIRREKLHRWCDAVSTLRILVGGEEFESPTPWMSTKYSNQLN